MSALDVPQMGRAEALERIGRVKASVDVIREDVLALWHGRAWDSLGYSDWYALCDAEFEVRIALPREQRSEVVTDLDAEGMSTRAIGAALGVSHQTVVRDLGVTNVTPTPTTGLDGKTYQPRPATVTHAETTTIEQTVEQTVDIETGEILAAEKRVIDYATDSDAYRQAVLRKRLISHLRHMGPPELMDPDEAAALNLDESYVTLLHSKAAQLAEWMRQFDQARTVVRIPKASA